MQADPGLGPVTVTATIWTALLAYFVAMTFSLRRSLKRSGEARDDSSPPSAALCQAAGEKLSRYQEIARRWWTLAVVAYLGHVAAAFHFHHGWSHERAYALVEEQSGFGPGIYITYTFSLLWTADAIWWWWRPAGRARRPRWLNLILHLFFAFILFNGAVVFETGPSRWGGLAGFLWLGWLLGRGYCTASIAGRHDGAV